MTYDEFETTFKPIVNGLADEDGEGETRFETYGPELDRVKAEVAAGREAHAWTIVEGDEGDLFVVPGYHHVNRFAYLITEVPAGAEHVDLEIRYSDDLDEGSDDKADPGQPPPTMG